MEKPSTLEAHHVYCIQLNRESLLLYMTEQGDSVYSIKLDLISVGTVSVGKLSNSKQQRRKLQGHVPHTWLCTCCTRIRRRLCHPLSLTEGRLCHSMSLSPLHGHMQSPVVNCSGRQSTFHETQCLYETVYIEGSGVAVTTMDQWSERLCRRHTLHSSNNTSSR